MNRGRADAPWFWGEETAGRTDQFQPEALPAAGSMDLERSAVLGVGAVAPPVQASGEAGGLDAVGATTGKAAWQRRLSPSHRAAVSTFFAPRGGQ